MQANFETPVSSARVDRLKSIIERIKLSFKILTTEKVLVITQTTTTDKKSNEFCSFNFSVKEINEVYEEIYIKTFEVESPVNVSKQIIDNLLKK